MELEKKWYVIHTYSGYENKVKANLERKIHSMGMEDKIFNVIVPVEKETEKRNGKEKVVERKIFPGYVLLEMIVDERSWYIVRNTPGVTGFVGSNTKPVPLTEEEANRILKAMGMDKPTELDVESDSLEPLMDLLIKEIPAPQGDVEGPLQMMVTTLDSDEYVGRVAIGRIMRGKIKEGQNVVVISGDGETKERVGWHGCRNVCNASLSH